jgi:hypothetical protein
MGEALQSTPFVDLYAPGDKIIYDLLTITFYVDEELNTWKEVHDWIRAMTFPENYQEYLQLGNLNKYTRGSNTGKPQYSDGMLSLLSSANNPKVKFKFYDLFPVSLSSLEFDATQTDVQYFTADVSFKYTIYNILDKTGKPL